MALASVAFFGVVVSSTPAGADAQSDLQAQAAQLESQIETTGQVMDALDQTYESAQLKEVSANQKVAATQAEIPQLQQKIALDEATIRDTLTQSHLSDEAILREDPGFPLKPCNGQDSQAAQEYAAIESAAGTTLGDLQNAGGKLAFDQAALPDQQEQAALAADQANGDMQQMQGLEVIQQQAQSQVTPQIAQIIQQQQEQSAQQAAQSALGVMERAQQDAQQSGGQLPFGQPVQAPPSESGGAAAAPSLPAPPITGSGPGAQAVAAAETEIGVPYIWGAEDPGVGFDCSGLTAWAWGKAGVALPHYSGDQMSLSAPVPISQLQPGDLLFYGPGGSQHVAMYVGNGEVIQAPYPGATVGIAPADFADGFVGAGRP